MKHDRILVSVTDKNGIVKLKRLKRRLFMPITPPSTPMPTLDGVIKVKKPSRKAVIMTNCKSRAIPKEALATKNACEVTELTINNSPDLEVLPENLSELPNLQYLDISGLPNIKKPIPLEKCAHLKKIWAIDTPLNVAIPSIMTLLMESEPMVVTDYGISNNEWPRLRRDALDILQRVVREQLGDDYDVYPYLEQILDDMRRSGLPSSIPESSSSLDAS
jgi:hypothetical protein